MHATEAPIIHPKTQKKMAKAKEAQKFSFVLRCMAYKSEGYYVAECVDLDIAVRAKTSSEAIRSLMQAMYGHLKVVLNEDGMEELKERGEVKGLLPRPSPFSHRLRYHYYCQLAALSGAKRDFRLFDHTPDCPSFA